MEEQEDLILLESTFKKIWLKHRLSLFVIIALSITPWLLKVSYGKFIRTVFPLSISLWSILFGFTATSLSVILSSKNSDLVTYLKICPFSSKKKCYNNYVNDYKTAFSLMFIFLILSFIPICLDACVDFDFILNVWKNLFLTVWFFMGLFSLLYIYVIVKYTFKVIENTSRPEFRKVCEQIKEKSL